jgi:hypothetical protein
MAYQEDERATQMENPTMRTYTSLSDANSTAAPNIEMPPEVVTQLRRRRS